MKNILFVCTGNTCRSCMASGILKDILKKCDRYNEFMVSSAGLYVGTESSANKYAIDVLKNEWGIDISDHIPRQLSLKDLEDADIILTMTNTHKCTILEWQGRYYDKIFTFKEYLGCDDLDILDPYGGTYDEYSLCAKDIKGYAEKLFEKLKRREKFVIAIGSDHAGLPLKNEIIKYFKENNIKFKDYGTYTGDSVDYSDYGKKVAVSVRDGECEKGIIICGTGIGISIAANKVKGIRASLCTNSYMAKMTRLHNDSNVLALGQRVTGVGLALDIVETWLNTKFEGGRHQKRIDKIKDIENEE